MKKILISGGSGLIGSRLTEMLRLKGYKVSHLSRTKKGDEKIQRYLWDVSKNYIEADALNGVDAVVHLAGAGIADKALTEKRKEEILKSRTATLDLLINTMKEMATRPSSLVSASGINFYGYDNSDKLLTEESNWNDDFISLVTRKWEQKAEEAEVLGVRVVKLRTGIVLSEKGGALEKLAAPFKMGLGAELGSGKQYMSWIHIDDLCRLFILAIENKEMKGSYNAAAPVPVTNKEFTQILAKALKKPLLAPSVPSWVLKTILGERANLILGSTRISSEKISKAGFKFEFKTIDEALRDIY